MRTTSSTQTTPNSSATTEIKLSVRGKVEATLNGIRVAVRGEEHRTLSTTSQHSILSNGDTIRSAWYGTRQSGSGEERGRERGLRNALAHSRKPVHDGLLCMLTL